MTDFVVKLAWVCEFDVVLKADWTLCPLVSLRYWCHNPLDAVILPIWHKHSSLSLSPLLWSHGLVCVFMCMSMIQIYVGWVATTRCFIALSLHVNWKVYTVFYKRMQIVTFHSPFPVCISVNLALFPSSTSGAYILKTLSLTLKKKKTFPCFSVLDEYWTESLPCLATLCESRLVKKRQTNAKLCLFRQIAKSWRLLWSSNIITQIFS